MFKFFIVNFIVYNYGTEIYSILSLHNCSGFLKDQIKFNLAVSLQLLTFLLFAESIFFFSGILNSNNKFAAAGAPIILVVLI